MLKNLKKCQKSKKETDRPTDRTTNLRTDIAGEESRSKRLKRLVLFSTVKYVMECFSLYFIVMFVRGIVMLVVFPLWDKIGLKFDWRQKIVAIWAGLRSPLVLIIGMVIGQTHILKPYGFLHG